MILESGKRYRATIRLGFFESMASSAQIAEKLSDAGFDEVEVWQPASSARDRLARGKWAGETKDVELPPQVASVEKIAD